MCSDCGDNPPLTLTCKTPELAQAYATVLNADGGPLANSRGEDIPATVNGATVTIPGNGNPMSLMHFGETALQLGLADLEACKDMGDRAMSAASGIPVTVLRDLRNGVPFAEAARRVTAEPPKDKVNELMGGLTRLLDGDEELPKFRPGDLFR